MNKFKIGQRVKIIDEHPYNNATGIITSHVGNSYYSSSYYYVLLDEKFYSGKIWTYYCYIIIDQISYKYAYNHPIIHEENLILINKNLDNE